MSAWALVYEGFDPKSERLREALCTLGNGYFATRGAAPEAEADGVHSPGTYLAGGYNRLQTKVADRMVENEDLVNMPNWLVMRFRPEGGEWLNPETTEVLAYRQELDLKEGVLSRTVTFKDVEGRTTTLIQRRFVHMGRMHLAGLETTVIPENWSGRLQVLSSLDGTVINSGVERYKKLDGKHLSFIRSECLDDETVLLLVETNQSEIRVAEAARTRVFAGDEVLEVERSAVGRPGHVGQEFFVDVSEKKPIRVEKIVSLFNSKDFAISEPALDAGQEVKNAPDFDELLHSHLLRWKHLWGRCDIRLHNSDRPQMILRLHIFHLLQTVSMNSIDLDVGVPARGWHGEAYRGHIFWDEIFIFPYLNVRIPVLTRSLLLYRYRRLDKARAAALNEGFKGALYPWQSSSNGREETQQLHLNPKSGRWLPDNTHLQRHVNAAIAYNVWQYYNVSGDRQFLNSYGAEMLLEIARFLADIATFNEELGRYEILGVMGPDEYHDGSPDSEEPGLNNNAYMNVMTVYVLRSALKAIELLSPGRRGELTDILALEQSELDRWREIIGGMRVVFHDGDIISQFEGYDALEELDWDAYRKKYDNIQRMDRILEAEGDTPNRYKLSKQADVLMLFYLFSTEELKELFAGMGYDFDPASIPRNVEYYLKRSSHGSTLSNVVHSWVLSRSDRAHSLELFQEALESDISDIQGGSTAEGIHLGAMAGTVDILQRCYTGLEFRDGMLFLNPKIPDDLPALSMKIQYMGNWFDISLTGERMTVHCDRCVPDAVRISFRGDVHLLRPGETLTFTLHAKSLGGDAN